MLLATGSAQASGPRTSVINGEPAKPGSFPYLAAVITNEGICSGTVVSSTVILTAGHCVVDADYTGLLSPSEFAVITGSVDRTAVSRTVSTVSRVAINPNFTYIAPSGPPTRADVAVLGLSQPITAPAVAIATTKTWGTGTPVATVGWGRTAADEPSPATLHYGEAVVQGSAFCSSESPIFQSAWNLCALDYPYEEFTTCKGDSGGPLLMIAPGTSSQPLQIGVTSYGATTCSPDRASFYARTDVTAPWLQRKIEEYAPPPPPPAPATPQAPSPTAGPRKLPALTDSAAKRLTLQALREGLGGRLIGRRAYRAACFRIEETKRKCNVSFWVTERVYWGSVTIYYAFEDVNVVWNARYKIKQASNRCLYYAANPNTCPTKIYRR